MYKASLHILRHSLDSTALTPALSLSLSSLSTMIQGADVFCPSPASSSSSSSQLGGRTIDRHNPIISDSRRSTGTSSNPSNLKTKTPHKIIKTSIKQRDTKKGISDDDDHMITPPCSSRYLLGNKHRQLFDRLPDFDPIFDSVPAEDQNKKVLNINEIEFTYSPEFPSSQPEPSSSNQVVVLRVSLHCKGCEGKLRKHLSRMKGVTSYNIDFAAKKVTIVGDVTPSSVLASVSKVKNARFWAASTTTAITHVHHD